MRYTRENTHEAIISIKDYEEKPAKEYEETKKQIKSKVVSFFVGIILTAIAFILGLSKFV